MIDTAPFKALYPFNSNWLDLAGLRYHYLDEGPREAPTVVMLHGNPTWSFYYRTLIPAVSKQYRVIVPDHMGCGLSDKPQDYPYNLQRHVQNLEALLDMLDSPNITLVLHDWGGVIGMGYATRYPERISSFVIFNTAAFYLPKLPRRILWCRSPLLGAVAVRGFNAFAGLAVHQATSQRQRMTAPVKAGYLAPYNSWHNRIAIHRFVQDIPWEDDHPTRPTLERIEAGLQQFRHHPMLIIWGADDFCFTERDLERDFLPQWQERFPEATTHILQGAGHYVVEDAHERILPLMMEFLEQQPDPR
jgi:haloalkane dehalogenase